MLLGGYARRQHPGVAWAETPSVDRGFAHADLLLQANLWLGNRDLALQALDCLTIELGGPHRAPQTGIDRSRVLGYREEEVAPEPIGFLTGVLPFVSDGRGANRAMSAK